MIPVAKCVDPLDRENEISPKLYRLSVSGGKEASCVPLFRSRRLLSPWRNLQALCLQQTLCRRREGPPVGEEPKNSRISKFATHYLWLWHNLGVDFDVWIHARSQKPKDANIILEQPDHKVQSLEIVVAAFSSKKHVEAIYTEWRECSFASHYDLINSDVPTDVGTLSAPCCGTPSGTCELFGSKVQTVKLWDCRRLPNVWDTPHAPWYSD